MTASRGEFAQLLVPALFKIIYDDLEMHPEEYSQLFNVETSDRAYEEDQLIAGLGTVPEKPEGQVIAYDDPIQGGTYRLEHTSFGLGFQVTREMWDDDKYGIMRKVSGDFAGSIRQTVESRAANVFNNSFTTQVGIDGVSIINTAHPLLGGGTYGNQVAAAALGATSLQEAVLIFEKSVNERGLLRRQMPEWLLIPSDLQFRAGEILYSTLKPFTGNNEINVMQGRLKPVINHYLSTQDGWWVLSEKNGHSLKFYWRVKPQFDSQDDFNTKSAKYSVYFRFSNGCVYWHGIVGAQGS